MPLTDNSQFVFVPRNYDFVPFPDKVNTSYVCSSAQRYPIHRYRTVNKDFFSGVIKLQIKAVDMLFLGSGWIDFEKENGLSATTLIENGKFVIPGSSLKGALRHVARAISDGCITSSDRNLRIREVEEFRQKNRARPYDERLPDNANFCFPNPNARRNEEFHVCIICDMFGSMGLGSKVTVTDFTADTCETAACLVPQQNNPHMEKDHYKQNGYHFGYKFYRTECEPRDSLTKDNRIYAVPAGTVFTGSIRFKGLRKKQLKLLLCSLGIGGHAFSHKLGGYRADGFGTVNLTCTAFTLNGETSTPAKAEQYALEYAQSATEHEKNRMKKLAEIMKYRQSEE